MAPHSSTLAWKIPWTEEPGRLQSMRSLRVGLIWLSDFTFTFHFPVLEKEMATHSSVLAWRIPGTGEPGGLRSLGSHRVGHNWSNLAAAAATELIGAYNFFPNRMKSNQILNSHISLFCFQLPNLRFIIYFNNQNTFILWNTLCCFLFSLFLSYPISSS